mgnify:CR=1 FL=1
MSQSSPLPEILGSPDHLLATSLTIPYLLSPARLVIGRRNCLREPIQALVAWGKRRSGLRAQEISLRLDLPIWRLEDAFLRSVDFGLNVPPLGVVYDNLGIHYDATCPSRLESLISSPLNDAQRQRGKKLIELWRSNRLSKSNCFEESPIPDSPYVLVIDQVSNDFSITYGLASSYSFCVMLNRALADYPNHTIVVKTHPDVVSGRRKGNFTSKQLSHPRVHVSADGAHPVSLIESADAVYVVTSQIGFEALIWGKPVYTFGMPFYAGWGLTNDYLVDTVANSRRSNADILTLVHACFVDYARYIDPESRSICRPEDLFDYVGFQRTCRKRIPQSISAYGFALWKRSAVRSYLNAMKPSSLRFSSYHQAPSRKSNHVNVVWGNHVGCGLRNALLLAEAPRILHVEDGFLRSIGQGWAFRWIPPSSWILDSSGIYYDCSGSSDLEYFLANHVFSDSERSRADRLRSQIVSYGLSKYNLKATPWRRPVRLEDRHVILIPGQVEVDLSLKYGMPSDSTVRSNYELVRSVRSLYPESFIIYKPHPDVVGRRRAAGADEHLVTRFCDLILPDAPIHSLLQSVDHVHVRTSITGFEALLRGTPVTTWGMPFYAGWGLTQDQLTCDRRNRSLCLSELVYAALIFYPLYLHAETGLFTSPENAIKYLNEVYHSSTRTQSHSKARGLLFYATRPKRFKMVRMYQQLKQTLDVL